MTDAVTHHADSVTHHAIPDAADKASNRRKRSARPTSAIERGAGRILPVFGTKRTLPPCATMSAFGGKADSPSECPEGAWTAPSRSPPKHAAFPIG
jgi:hypothetical protein